VKQEPQSNPLSLQRYIRPIWRFKWMTLAVVIGVTAGSYYYAQRKPKQYRATTRVILLASPQEQQLPNVFATAVPNDRVTADEAVLIVDPATAGIVARILHYRGDPFALLSGVSATPVLNADFIDISAVNRSPIAAARIANGFANAFAQERRNQVLSEVKQTIATDTRQLNTTPPTSAANRTTRTGLIASINQLGAALNLPGSPVQQVTPAAVPGSPFAPRPKQIAVFAFVIALILSILAAFGLERFSDQLFELEDLESGYGQPVLAMLPHAGRANPVSKGKVTVAPELREALRTLRTSLDLLGSGGHRTLLIVSALPNEGKSTVTRNLAMAYAESGKRVVVIESDARKPGLAKMCNARAEPGLTQVLAGSATFEDSRQSIPLDQAFGTESSPASTNGQGAVEGLITGSFTLLSSGPPVHNPPGLLNSPQMLELLREVREKFDIVLVDSAPVLAVSDALPLLPEVDGVIVVTRLGLIRRNAARRFLDVVGRVEGHNILGVVANDVRISDLSYGGAGSYYGDEAKASTKTAA
jgi:Mrp family chromosome partitioning ATPase/capsular polysaccharide biosynthesis protein